MDGKLDRCYGGRVMTRSPLPAAVLAASIACAAACGSKAPTAPPPPPAGAPAWWSAEGEALGALPETTNARSRRVMTADECACCPATHPESSALLDAKQRDVSPYNLWKATMMGLSSRDPYFLAVFRHELDEKPGAAATLEKTCTRCHAPMGAVEQEARGSHVRYEDLLGGTSPNQVVAREGVACPLCHQIKPDGLGTPASFTGGYVIGKERLIFGPHENPFTRPMEMHVAYTPTHAPHMETSAVCGTCHTVITHALDADGNAVGPAFYEQAPFLEWQASSFNDEGNPTGKPCQGCHMPAVDDDGEPIVTALSVRPGGLTPRTLKGRHVFAGGNAFMLRLLAQDPKWTGAAVTADELNAQADRDEAMLGRAATLQVKPRREGAALVFDVEIGNESGHKLPTGFPSRRVVVHAKVTAPDGAVVFESGRLDEFGRLVGRAGQQLDAAGVMLPHRDVIDREVQAQVYEAVMGNAESKIADVLIDATHFLKDNRLLPRGFDPAHPAAEGIRPVGTEADANHGATDTITYRVEAAPAGSRVEVELLYQSIRPSELEVLARHPNPAALKLFALMKSSDKRSTRLHVVEATAP